MLGTHEHRVLQVINMLAVGNAVSAQRVVDSTAATLRAPESGRRDNRRVSSVMAIASLAARGAIAIEGDFITTRPVRTRSPSSSSTRFQRHTALAL
jgi:hypothetical protein